MQDRLEYAERRLEEEIKNGEMRDIQYWRGYRDAVKQIERQPCKELNIEDIRSMNGKAVYSIPKKETFFSVGGYGIVDTEVECIRGYNYTLRFKDLDLWTVYRRKPHENENS